MKLIVKKYGQQIMETVLEPGLECIVGRDESCDIVLDAEPGISRKHFKIHRPEGGAWTIESLSTQGEPLYAEGEPVQGAEIEESAVLTFKNYIFEFAPEAPEEPEPGAQEEAEFATSPGLAEEPDEKTETAARIPSSKRSDEQERGSESGADYEGTSVLSAGSISYFLAVSIDENKPEYINLNHGESWILGRKEDCDISINHPGLSKEHVKISRIGNRFFIEDLKSSNGTFLNDRKLSPEKPYSLKSEDRIEMPDMVMTFEARNKQFSELLKNLPAAAGQTQVIENPLAESGGGGGPKIILEEAFEEEPKGGQAQKFLNPKRLILLGVLVLAVGGGIWMQLQQPKKPAGPTPQQLAEEAKTKVIQDLYRIAVTLYQQKKYQFCIENLENLHEKTSYYKDSKELLIQCHNALSARKRLEEQRALKKEAEEIERKIMAQVELCRPKTDIFETVEELNICLAEALQLNPGHPEIGALQRIIEERESLKALKKQEEEERRKTVAARRGRYRAMYQKVKKQHDRAKLSGDQELLLKAADAYDRFVKAARNESYMAKQRRLAAETAANIRKTYSDTLSNLYSDCESLINQKQMKQAYPVCKKILDFKENDAKALQWMREAKIHLRKKLQSVYKQSAAFENLSQISAAKPLWRRIVQEDIQGGYYYEKAHSKLKKYK